MCVVTKLVMAESNFINICVPVDVPYILQNKPKRLTGETSALLTDMVEIISRKFNKSIIYSSFSGSGKRINSTELYGDCLGQLQTGKAEAMLYISDYPLDVVNITQGYTVFSEKMGFLATFEYPKSYSPADFIKSFSSFDKTIWFLIFFTLSVFFWFIVIQNQFYSLKKNFRTNRKSKKKRKIKIKLTVFSVLLSILSHIIGSNGLINQKTISHRIIFYMLSVFSFFIMAHFNSLLNMDTVVITQPFILRSYDQMIQHNIRPIFIESFSDYERLSFDDETTKGRQFWDWAYGSFGKNVFVKTSAESLCQGINDVVRYKAALITLETNLRGARFNFCNFLNRDTSNAIAMLNYRMKQKKINCTIDVGSPESFQTYINFDPGSKDISKGFIWGKKVIENKKYFKISHSLMRDITEYGHFIYIRHQIQKVNLAEGDAFKDVSGRIIQEKILHKYRCGDDQVYRPETSIPSVTLRQLLVIFSFLVSLSLFSALFILYLEKVTYKKFFSNSKLVTIRWFPY